MAKDTENTAEKPKRVQKPRPIYVIYRTGSDGDIEVTSVTRDPAELVKSIQADPASTKFYEHKEPLGR